MLTVKLISLSFAFLYVLSLQLVDGELARDILQFNVFVLMSSVVVRLFGDIYYISSDQSLGTGQPFRVSIYDLLVVSMVAPLFVIFEWEPYGVPSLYAGLIIATHSLSIISSRYLQRTGAPRAAFLFISTPYFCMVSPIIVFLGAVDYGVLLASSVAHLSFLIIYILYRGIWRIHWRFALDIRQRMEQSGALFVGIVVSQGGLSLIVETLPPEHVADVAMYYRIAALVLIPLMSFSMGKQLEIVDNRHLIYFGDIYKKYLFYIQEKRVVFLTACLIAVLACIVMVYRGAPIGVLGFVTLYYVLNVASGPIVFFSVMVTRYSLLMVAVIFVIACASYGVSMLGVSGATALAIGYGMFLMILVRLLLLSGRLQGSNKYVGLNKNKNDK